jgi:hypothetical protein
MMRGRQSQEGGDSSLNIQAQGDISFGLGYGDVRKAAMDVFKANFIELRDEAAELAYQRAETLINRFLEQAAADGLTQIPEGKNPDFQYALYSAHREYARTGDEDLGDLLVQLLVDRAKIQERDLEQIVLNESLELAPKLTPDQMDALSLVFITRYTKSLTISSPSALYASLDMLILPFVEGASRKNSAYQHLEFAGCGTISASDVDPLRYFTRNYPGVLSQGFTEDELAAAVVLTPDQRSEVIRQSFHDEELLQVNAIDEEFLDELSQRLGIEADKAYKLKLLLRHKVMPSDMLRQHMISVRPRMAQYFELWDEALMRNFTLTSVGIAIAHANIKRKTGEDFNLSTWM